MRTKFEEVTDLKIRVILAAIAIVGMVVLAGTYQGNMVRGAASGPTPRVTAITQVTHDGYPKTNLLADDSQVFVTEMPSSDRIIARVKLPGTDRSVVASPLSNLQALDFSPDHSKLLVSSKSKSGDSEFWTLPVPAGAPVRVGDLTGRDASWSADGKHLAFAKGSVLYLSTANGNDAHALYTATGSIFAVHFSPDAHRIRFTVSDTEANSTSLWEVERDGSKPHALLGEWPLKSTACCGSWTSDGRYYIFQATQSVPNTSIVITSLWAVSDSDVALFPLTSGPMSFGNPSAAHGEGKIWAIGVQPSVDVVKFEAHKKRFVPIIRGGLSATDVDFSKDEKWIAYVSVPDGALWRSKADGSQRLQLTSGAERTALPRWSPDGNQIAYVSMKPGESWKLYLIPAEGGTPEPVVQESGSQIDANWSADGTRLMYGDYSHDAAGLSIRMLDFKSHKIETIPGSQGLFSPRWSPDGQYIAAISPDNTTLMRFDFKTQQWSTWMKESAGSVSYPVWSVDSEYLYFDDVVTGAETIRRLKVGGGAPEEVVVPGSLDRYPGHLGLWTGRAPDGSWMFVKDRSTQEVYQLSLELP